MVDRVLLVDDELRVVDSLKRRLFDEPYEVLTASSGDEALRLLGETPCNVLISDERMPDMLGSELLAIVRTIHPTTVGMILTGHADVGVAAEAVNDGVFRFLTKPCSSADIKLHIAQALEASKQRQARVSLHQPASARDEVELAAGFSRALDSLWMAMQPIGCVANQTSFGCEALVRSNEATLPHPGALFDAARLLNREQELERRIREKVAEIRVPDSGILFMNIEPATLNDSELFAADAPLSRMASGVVLELTERRALDDVDAVTDKLAELRKLGFRIALDDLGAGYAGLTSISLLNPDIVKFDMTLVRDIHCSETKAKMIASMTKLFRDLGTRTVAEGVESVEELERLIELGCDLYQGYLFARPASPFPQVQWPAKST